MMLLVYLREFFGFVNKDLKVITTWTLVIVQNNENLQRILSGFAVITFFKTQIEIFPSSTFTNKPIPQPTRSLFEFDYQHF
jgi:hypothetical protein